MSFLTEPAQRTITFSRLLEEGVAVINVHLDRWEALQNEPHPYRVWAVAAIAAPDENGLPNVDEAWQLDGAARALLDTFPDDGRSLHLGLLTHGGQQAVVVYSQRPDLAGPDGRGILEAGGYLWAIYSDEDPDYEFIIERMLPRPEEQRRMQDAATMQALADAGDDPYQPRTIHFASYFSSMEDAQAAAVKLAKSGFKTNPAEATEGEAAAYYPVVLTYHRISSTERDSVEAFSSRAAEATEACHGAFAGWSCDPVSGGMS